MSNDAEVEFHIKVVINKEKSKVLFAEAGSDFTDVLLSFLLLPLRMIVEVIEKHYGDKAPVIGSLNTLYKGAKDLDIIHFYDEDFKIYVIDDSTQIFASELRKLRLNISGTQPTSSSSGKSYDGVFTDSAASFIISDDLFVLPITGCSIIETLSTLGIAVEDLGGTETIPVAFGRNEIIGLLKESLISSNPLTALIFPGKKMTVETKGDVLLNQIDQKDTFMISEDMTLKVMLQKSTNKFLFAQANSDFVDFLFEMLITPLGKVEWYMRSNTGLTNMDNLHRSVSNNRRLKCNEDLLIKANPYAVTSFMKKASIYMVSDGLTVAPLGVTSGLSVINELKISLSDIKEVKLQVGLEEGLSILKAALTSTTALTDGLIKPFLNKQPQLGMEQQLESKWY